MGRNRYITLGIAISIAGAMVACDLHTLHEPDTHIPLNDSETPYAGVPRIVIDTKQHREVLDRENDVDANIQIYGSSAIITDVLPAIIRGRGNTSWEGSDKKSYKIEFDEKISLLGMPENQDWALISNFDDNTLMKNYIVYKLSEAIGMPYSPRSAFVEVYINGEYQGLYTLTETVKVGKKRVDILQNEYSYLVEVDQRYRKDEQVITTDMDIPFRIHSPKDISQSSQDRLLKHLNDFEHYLAHMDSSIDNHVEDWIDIDSYIKHYWIQELTKNPDGGFFTSVFFTWEEDDVIKMGPVWDFDLSMGGHANKKVSSTDGLHIRGAYWNEFLFKDKNFGWHVNDTWYRYQDEFLAVLDSMDACKNRIRDAAIQNFKRWPGLTDDYDKSVEEAKTWYKKRMDWLNKFVPKP